MPEITTLIQVLTIVNILLEDVAEDPSRLTRAQQLAEEQISEVLKDA